MAFAGAAERLPLQTTLSLYLVVAGTTELVAGTAQLVSRDMAGSAQVAGSAGVPPGAS